MDAIVAIAAFPVTFAVLWLLLRTTLGARLVAHPTGERWHAEATPTFGGVGIFAGFVAGVGAALAIGAVEWSGELGGILAGATLLFAVGLIDDLRHLSPIVKLAAQVGAAVIALASGLHVEIVENDVLAWGIGILWLVGISNAFNLLDNMDGLAATLAAIACAYFAIDALSEHPSETVLVLSLALGLACTAFLPFNLRPGRSAAVFMGDSGSLVLGFALASFALASSWTVAGTTVATVLLPLLILAIPILDTTLVTLVRLGQRRPVSQGGRDHTSHRLVYYGLSEANAVLLLALVAAAIGATALAYNVLDNARLTAFGVLLTFVLLVQFGSFLSDLEERSRRGEADRAGVAVESARVRAPPSRRGGRRLRRHLCDVPRRVPARDRRARQRIRAIGLPRGAADSPRDEIRGVRRARRLSKSVALRDRARRDPDRARMRRFGGPRILRARRSPGHRLVSRARGVRRRRRALHVARRSIAADVAPAPGGPRTRA